MSKRKLFIGSNASLEPKLGKEYQEEFDKRGNHFDDDDVGKKVRYLSTEESNNFKVRYNSLPNRGGIYVLAPTMELFSPFEKKGDGFFDKNGVKGGLRHSSITHSEQEANGYKSVICAGHIKMSNGKITSMDNNSGHFKPSAINLYIAAKTLMPHFADNAEIGVVVGMDDGGDAEITKVPVKAFISMVEEKLSQMPDYKKSVDAKIEELQAKRVQLEERELEQQKAQASAAVQAPQLQGRGAMRRNLGWGNSPVKENRLDDRTPKSAKRGLFDDEETPAVAAVSDGVEKKRKGDDNNTLWQTLVGKKEPQSITPLSPYNHKSGFRGRRIEEFRTPPGTPSGRF